MEYNYKLSDIKDVARSLLNDSTSNIFAFQGNMGVGKTTLIKEILQFLGVKDIVTSPTFSLVNEFAINEKVIYHFDLYRIEDVTELMDIGFEEYLYNGDYIFIEWPEKILSLLPENYTLIKIKKRNQEERTLNLYEVKLGKYLN